LGGWDILALKSASVSAWLFLITFRVWEAAWVVILAVIILEVAALVAIVLQIWESIHIAACQHGVGWLAFLAQGWVYDTVTAVALLLMLAHAGVHITIIYCMRIAVIAVAVCIALGSAVVLDTLVGELVQLAAARLAAVSILVSCPVFWTEAFMLWLGTVLVVLALGWLALLSWIQIVITALRGWDILAFLGAAVTAWLILITLAVRGTANVVILAVIVGKMALHVAIILQVGFTILGAAVQVCARDSPIALSSCAAVGFADVYMHIGVVLALEVGVIFVAQKLVARTPLGVLGTYIAIRIILIH
jgi:hypothetical protein